MVDEVYTGTYVVIFDDPELIGVEHDYDRFVSLIKEPIGKGIITKAMHVKTGKSGEAQLHALLYAYVVHFYDWTNGHG